MAMTGPPVPAVPVEAQAAGAGVGAPEEAAPTEEEATEAAPTTETAAAGERTTQPEPEAANVPTTQAAEQTQGKARAQEGAQRPKLQTKTLDEKRQLMALSSKKGRGKGGRRM
jgi:hypothetical protein